MKKRDQRLHLHRETLLQIGQPDLDPKSLRKVNGGDVSSCFQLNCLCPEA